MVMAAFSKQSVVDHAMYVQLVQKRVAILSYTSVMPKFEGHERRTYLGYRRCKDNYFVQFTHPFHELIHARTLDNVHVMIVALNFNRNGKISLVEYLQIISKCS